MKHFSKTTSDQRITFRRAGAALIGLVVTTAAAVCLAPAGAGNLEGKTILLPVGTTFEGRMDSTISSGHSRQGDRFTIGMSTPVLANGSDVIVPAGSQIMGEVVEAISSGNLPRQKKQPKPHGKLRVQLSGLRTPEGITYPLIASLAPETFEGSRTAQANANLGGGVAYVGSEASFNTATPVSNRGGRGAQSMVSRQDMMRNPLYGRDGARAPGGRIRSLVVKGHELYLENGSPVTVRLDAPLKLAISPSAAAAVPYAAAEERANRGGRRFSPEQEVQQQGPFTPGSLPFLHSNNAQPVAPSAPPQPLPPAAPQQPNQNPGQGARAPGASDF